jgi:4-hydroxy-tetrahydrodipicolinate reductase
MSIRVLVNGAQGRMGQATVTAINADPLLTLVGTTGRNDNLADAIHAHKAEVVVDFTNADAVLRNTQIIIASGAHPVIGSSGLRKEDVQALQATCKELKRGGLIAPNFSLGAVLMMKYAQDAAKYFQHVEIIEMHHDRKLDSPSGTALRTAEMIAENFKPAGSTLKTKETVPGARGATYQDIPIHAIRLPGLVAHQQVIFGDTGETLTLSHDSIDRIAFMPGVCLACKKVMSLQELMYGLEQVL